jgi:hypothetical protein
VNDLPESRTKPRYAFASDLDGDLCLITSAETSDWRDWRVYEADLDGGRSAIEPSNNRFAGYVHGDSVANWNLEWATHVEAAIPGERVIVMHPGVFQSESCPVCGYKGPRQMPRAGDYLTGGARAGE